jgi:hypothetical protein
MRRDFGFQSEDAPQLLLGRLGLLGVDFNPTAVATVLIKDTFTAVNGTTLPTHTPDINTPGHAWVIQSGAGNIQSNTAQCSTATMVATIDCGQANVTVSCDSTINGASADNGPVVRFQDINNYWLGDVSMASGAILYEKLSGSFISRSTKPFLPVQNSTYSIQLNASNATITLTVGGVGSCSYSSATDFQAATLTGFKMDNAGDQTDNFIVSSGAGGGGPANVLVLDQFRVANGTTLTGRTPQPMDVPNTTWTAQVGTMQVNNNLAVVNALSGGEAVYTVDAGQGDSTVSADTYPGTLSDDMVVIRFQDNNNYFAADCSSLAFGNGGQRLIIYEKQTGTFTQRAATGQLTITTGTLYPILISAVGTSINATINGGNAIAFTSTDFQTQTKAGFRANASDTKFGNFQVQH